MGRVKLVAATFTGSLSLEGIEDKAIVVGPSQGVVADLVKMAWYG